MDSIGRGAQRATQECQYQFQWERWNCDITSAQLMQSEQPRGRRKKLITLSQTRTKIYTENRRFSRLYQNTLKIHILVLSLIHFDFIHTIRMGAELPNTLHAFDSLTKST